jgi:DMSO/TMAO reductase YedYZ molybdopterin-dependent catalytic subunit
MRISTYARRAVVALLVVSAALVAPSAAQASRGAQHPHKTTFTVNGDVRHRLSLTMRDLRTRFPGHTEHVTFTSGTGTEHHTYRGALLTDVVTAAAPRFDASAHNDALGFAVTARGTDNYVAALSWGEIDPEFGGTKALLAYAQDHKPLPRPRLVVPGDLKGGRYVSDVATVGLYRVGR